MERVFVWKYKYQTFGLHESCMKAETRCGKLHDASRWGIIFQAF